MSDTEKSLLKSLGVVLATMFVLAVLVSIGAVSGREGASPPIMQAAGMMGPRMRSAEVPAPALSLQDFQDLVHCVHEIQSLRDAIVPGSERPGGKYLTFATTLLYTIDLRLHDAEGGIEDAIVYSKSGRKIGRPDTLPQAGPLTEQAFVDAGYTMLHGPCSASVLSSDW